MKITNDTALTVDWRREYEKLEAENRAFRIDKCRVLKRENEVLRDGIRAVLNHIPPIMEAHDVLLALLHPDVLLATPSDTPISDIPASP